MNYQRIYDAIISKARSENRKKGNGIYYESHHIIPRCLNGNNDKENKVLLTAKEHFICHKLLYKIYPKNKSIGYGLYCMAYMFNEYHKRIKLSSREYENIKCIFIESLSGEGNGMYKKSVYDLWIEKYGIEEANKRKELCKIARSKKFSGAGNPNYGKIASQETRNKIKQKAIGRHPSKETLKKLSIIRKKIFNTPEMKEKLSKQSSGKNNGMYRTSAFKIWITLYGEEEAKIKKEHENIKRKKSWDLRWERLYGKEEAIKRRIQRDKLHD